MRKQWHGSSQWVQITNQLTAKVFPKRYVLWREKRAPLTEHWNLGIIPAHVTLRVLQLSSWPSIDQRCQVFVAWNTHQDQPHLVVILNQPSLQNVQKKKWNIPHQKKNTSRCWFITPTIYRYISTGWWFQPLWKIWTESHLGVLFPIHGKIKNGPNHQPDKC